VICPERFADGQTHRGGLPLPVSAQVWPQLNALIVRRRRPAARQLRES